MPHSLYSQDRAEKKLKYQEKVLQAIEQYHAGVSLRAIGLALGYSEGTALTAARKLVMRAISQAINLEVEEMRTVQAMRYDALLAVDWPKALQMDLGVQDRVLQIMRQKEELFGLKITSEGKHGPQLVQQAVIILPANDRDGQAAIQTTAKASPIPLQPR